jgi:HAD superfamily hydrolase (TIGR01458 family)
MQALLFDMDGVIYNSEALIPGAPETLAWVREHRIPHMFVTNTTSRGRNVLVEKLKQFGIPATEDDILTPCVAAREFMGDSGPVALFVPEKSHAEFAGMDLLPEDRESGARWVVVGDLGERWDFQTLNRAFRLLQSTPEAELIALGLTRFWQASDGLRLDTAPFVAALECATGRKAVVMGKPAAGFFEAAVRRLGVPKDEVLMIGDDIRVDVGGAQRAGLKGALVKTGKYRAGDLEGAVKPDFVMDSIAALPRLHVPADMHPQNDAGRE